MRIGTNNLAARRCLRWKRCVVHPLSVMALGLRRAPHRQERQGHRLSTFRRPAIPTMAFLNLHGTGHRTRRQHTEGRDAGIGSTMVLWHGFPLAIHVHQPDG